MKAAQDKNYVITEQAICLHADSQESQGELDVVVY